MEQAPAKRDSGDNILIIGAVGVAALAFSYYNNLWPFEETPPVPAPQATVFDIPEPQCLIMLDADCDGILNRQDFDDDNDGIWDISDPHPRFHEEGDPDQDFILTANDPHPNTSEWSDLDNDGVMLIADNYEGNDLGDEDGDGIKNGIDPFPETPAPVQDRQDIIDQAARNEMWIAISRTISGYGEAMGAIDSDFDGIPDSRDIYDNKKYWED